jgi:sirohydrochlorin cobaltochelatase
MRRQTRPVATLNRESFKNGITIETESFLANLFLEMSSAYLLVFHGSRDPRPRVAVTRLADLVRQQLTERQEGLTRPPDFSSLTALAQKENIILDTASLELAETPLHQRIEQCTRTASECGFSKLEITPLFLLSGVHVLKDIPAEVALARSNLPVELKPHLGSYQGIDEILSQQLASFPAEARILLSHGSRHPVGCQRIESLADRLQAFPAYWSVEPSLPVRVEALIESGIRSITILPYFLFSGTITDEIDRQVFLLSQKHKNVKFFLNPPLGATAKLARVIVEEARK